MCTVVGDDLDFEGAFAIANISVFVLGYSVKFLGDYLRSICFSQSSSPIILLAENIAPMRKSIMFLF